jgi:peptidoglycan-associated lipoprotein
MNRSLKLIATTLLVGACSSTPTEEQAGARIEDRTPQPIAPAQVKPVTADSANERMLAALKDPNSPLSKRSVYFEYDQYVIAQEYQSLIEAHGRFLATNPGLKVTIQGNADERGSREYNLALGQKRAEVMRKALVLIGAKDGQVEAVSLGEEKPVCPEKAEACWAKNRRGDILYLGVQ